MKITLREAKIDDGDMLFSWRNSMETRRYSKNDKLITKEEHYAWLSSVFSNDNKLLLIAETGHDAVGVLRYDIHVDIAMVSIYLRPDLYGKGIGSAVLKAGKEWLLEKDYKIQLMRAEIMADNIASRKLFEKNGFILKHSVYELEI